MVGDPDNGESSACMGGEGNGNTLQYSSLGNPMDTGAWWATVHGVTKESDMTTKQRQQQGMYGNRWYVGNLYTLFCCESKTALKSHVCTK